jgi:hypothetical protein
MKPIIENVYIDGAKEYDVKRLWSLVKNREPKRHRVLNYDFLFDAKVWYKTPKEIIKNKRGSHWNRIKNANLKYPIIVDEDGHVVDGCHRWCKALIAKRKTIRVHIVTKKDLRKAQI